MGTRIEKREGDGVRDLYDGFEPNDYGARVVPHATETWLQFTFSELATNDFRRLESVLGSEAFARIVAGLGARQTMEGGPFVGATGLSLTYALSEDGAVVAVVGFGEWQPARYRVIVEGVWRVIHSA